MARNWTASPFSFPGGLRALGVRMMLFLQGFADDNVYDRARGGEYAWAGQSVDGDDAERFFADRLDEAFTNRAEAALLT